MSGGILQDPDDALDRIVSALAVEVPSGVKVLRIGGLFGATEVRRHLVHAPVVLIACLGLTDYGKRGSGGWTMTADLAAYVLTKDRDGEVRDTLSLALVADVLRLIGRAHWGAPDAFGLPDPTSLDAANLYGGDLDSIAVSLWLVRWAQPFYFTS